ncbi:MAG: aminopeptidase [Desulfovibrio sp.]|jgi:aspartyl aminopeptidase|nr:aminopeptidase [Desulfovibrio sp.]
MSSLEYTPKNCWEVYASGKDIRDIENLAARYIAFLTRCKTERETVDYVCGALREAGFSSDTGTDKILLPLQGKAVLAARRGRQPLARGIHLIFAHTDSPRLDFKQHPLQEQSSVGQAKTHYYGGIRKYQWFARPLALHGVAVKDNGESVRIVLGEEAGEPVFTIADLLPHLAGKQMDQSLREAFDAEKMNIVLGHRPLFKEEAEPGKKRGKNGSGKESSKDDKDEMKSPIKANLLRILHERFGVVEEDLYSAELQAVPAGPALEVGLDASLIGGFGQDDRINVFLALEAMLQGLPEQAAHTQALAFFDKEEIGSEGSTGAKSRFFEYCVQDMLRRWEAETLFAEVMLSSRGISADVHAATDPDWPDLHEKLNAALLGYGPCFCKFTGSRGKYEANDAHPEYIAWLRGLLNRAGIPWQMAELGKVDQGGGGTVAMHFARYGMNIIDCGPAVLSMHSPFELTSKVDLYATSLAFREFLNAE